MPLNRLRRPRFESMEDRRLMCAAPCRVDFDGNGKVEFADFLILSNEFGSPSQRADANGDGVADFADFLELSASFGMTVEGGDTFQILSPSGLTNSRPTIRWSALEDASSYTVLIGKDLECEDLVSKFVGATPQAPTAFTLPFPLEDGEYHICVDAMRDSLAVSAENSGVAISVSSNPYRGFLDALDRFVEDPDDTAALQTVLDFSPALAETVLEGASVDRRLHYYLAHLNVDRDNPKLSAPLFEYTFNEVAEVARRTFWRVELPRIFGDDVYFHASEKIEGQSAVNTIYLQAFDFERKIHTINLITERVYIVAPEDPPFRWASALYGNVERYLHSSIDPNFSQRLDSRSLESGIPEGIQIPTTPLTLQQVFDWGQNAFPLPDWAEEFIPEEYKALI